MQYEKLVEQQEPETRRLLAFCELPWNEDCLHFEDDAAPVSTASAVQVRTPLYRSSVHRWKRYESAMAPRRELLESAGIKLKG